MKDSNRNPRSEFLRPVIYGYTPSSRSLTYDIISMHVQMPFSRAEDLSEEDLKFDNINSDGV